MSSLAFLRPAAACVVAGAALYVTRGVLDQVNAGDAVVRIALLPPWQALAGFLGLAGLMVLGLTHLNAPRGTSAGPRPRLGELTLPMLAAGLLLVPFLPLLPDRLPVLQALAGPLRGVVWLVVVALMVWALWQVRLIIPRWLSGWSLAQLTVGIGLATALASGAAAARLTGTTLFPSGDEPHYLVMAQSLWRDHDLRIENNHERGDYREYFKRDLEPDYLTRGVDQEIYSIHPVGLPVLLAPVYAAGGYRAVVWLLIALAAVAAAVAWRWTVATLNAPGAATFAWAAVVLSAPYLFNSFAIYPEIAAGLAVMLALTRAQKRGQSPFSGWLVAGIACSVLPWLSTKYAPMSAALMAVALLRLEKNPAALIRNSSTPWLVLPYAASLAAWAAYFYTVWGSPLPTAPYGSMTQTSPVNLVFGAPGLLFDQEYGLLAYAPVYALAATGLFALWRSGPERRRQAIEVAVVFAALLGTVGAHRLWWGGTAAPARPLASGLLLLALPIAAAFHAAPAGSARRAGQHLLLWVSVGIALTLALAQNGLLVINDRDGTSALLEFWSPRWQAWALAPTFITQHTATGLLHSAWWLAIAAAAGIVLSRWRAATAGAAALAAVTTFSAALLVIAITLPWLPVEEPLPGVDLGARARLPALDAYDTRALPAAVVFDPLRRVAPADVVGWLAVGVTPGQRPHPAPLRVLHNGRFSLPAGRYDVVVSFGPDVPDGPRPLSLQIGRIEPPLQTWIVQPAPGEQWRTTLDLPVDAAFVGLRGREDLERAIRAITITPTAIVNAGERLPRPQVLSAARYGDVTMFLHDETIYAEATGFWAPGGRAVEITIAVPPGRTAPVVLQVHGGSKPNRATLSTGDWSERVPLQPGQPQTVTLPVAPSPVFVLTVKTDDGFRPSDVDAASSDSRFLGLWIEVKKEP